MTKEEIIINPYPCGKTSEKLAVALTLKQAGKKVLVICRTEEAAERARKLGLEARVVKEATP